MYAVISNHYTYPDGEKLGQIHGPIHTTHRAAERAREQAQRLNARANPGTHLDLVVALAMAEERRKLRRWQLRLRWRRTMRGNSAERLRWRAWRQANGVPLESAWTFAVPIAGPKGRLP